VFLFGQQQFETKSSVIFPFLKVHWREGVSSLCSKIKFYPVLCRHVQQSLLSEEFTIPNQIKYGKKSRTASDWQVECETKMKAIELKEICVDIDIQLPREECRKEEREECR
jgi:hypothetical protein